MKTLAIIGTAGRKDDASKLTLQHWHRMVAAARKIINLEKCDKLVSGGAAWADHVAVEIGIKDKIKTKIWLPENGHDLNTAHYYHGKFSVVRDFDTWKELNSCFKIKNFDIQSFGGFKDRNSKVAEEADIFLAMTFGERAKVKDGGTADTVNKILMRGINGYHLDLNTLKLYKFNPWKETLDVTLKFKATRLEPKEASDWEYAEESGIEEAHFGQ